MIVSHEKIHVREKHTFDILFTEILFLFQWFNPFAWLMKGAIKNNLEYKTDDEIAKIFNPQKYQLAMVALADKKGVAPFLTALNGSQLKNRIIMMKKKTGNKFAFVKQLIVLPLLAILVMGLSNKEVKTKLVQPKSKVEVIVDGKIIPSNDKRLGKVDFSKGINSMDVINALNINNVVANDLNMDREVPTLYIRTSDYISGTDLEFEKNTNTDIFLDKDKSTEEFYYAIDNKIVSEEEYLEKGKDGFENVVILSGKDATDKYGEKYENVADATTGTPNFIIKDGKKDWPGENTNLDFNPDTVGKKEKTSGETITGNVINEKGEPIKSAKINNENIPDSIDLSQSTKLRIRTNDNEKQSFGYLNNFRTRSIYDSLGDPLILVDGKIASDINSINPENIDQINVLKDPDAVKPYGKLGRNGVVLITTRNANQKEIKGSFNNNVYLGISDAFSLDGNPTIISSANSGLNVRIRQTADTKEQPLVLVDGVPYNPVFDQEFNYASANIEDFGKLIHVAPEDIKSIEVLKDATSMALYGEKARNGAILITTKNPVKRILQETTGDPIIIVDGQRYDSFDDADVPVKDIASITVLKNESAKILYGEQAKNGVIIINTKTKYNSDVNGTSMSKVKETDENGEPVFYEAEEMPRFPGGELALDKWIAKELKYPELAKEKEIQGTVYVTFIVTKKGKIESPQISKGVDPVLDKEALRIISSFPKWKPGKQRGKTVNVSFTVPVKFALSDN